MVRTPPPAQPAARREMIKKKSGTFLGLLFTGGLLLFSAVTTVDGDVTREKVGDEFATATFAGGCFWCMESPFDELDGVISTTAGYTGGHKAHPTYKEVSAGGTGHAEAVQVVYDPKKISFERLLEVFWRNIDPLDKTGQFCDKGNQYRSAIFYHTERQKRLAEE